MAQVEVLFNFYTSQPQPVPTICFSTSFVISHSHSFGATFSRTVLLHQPGILQLSETFVPVQAQGVELWKTAPAT